MNKKDKEKIKKSLLGLKSDYEKLRAKIIKEKGYDYFRKHQKEVFEDIFKYV